MVRWIVAILTPLAAAAADPGYVGSKACAGCHRELYDRYLRTAMGQSMRPATDARDLARVTKPAAVTNGNHLFEIQRDGNALFQTESEADVFRTRYRLEYAIGSGVNGSTYLVSRGNYLLEAPLSYFSRTRAWELSPGYESGNPGFARPIAAACVACHSGRPQPVANREGLFADPPFQEVAIGCENCHGPGRDHVRQAGARKAIVNPARLQWRLAEDICMSCHQAGDTRVLMPGRSYADFRPGTPLSETVAIFKIPMQPGDAKLQDLLEHHFAMHLSKCFTAGRGRLSCLTCHNPHTMPAAETAGDYYRRKCLGCHTEASCKLPRARRITEAADHCTTCHMPKRDVGIISHSALTNHRIIARAGEPLPATAFEQTSPDLPDLLVLNRREQKKPPPVVLLQAYGELMGQAPQFRERYLALLAELTESSPKDPVVQAALGQKAFLQTDTKAIAHLTKAIELGFVSATVYENLAEALVRDGRTPEAIEVLKKGVDVLPYAPRLHKFLAARYIDLKQYDQAKQAMERYIELFPDDDFVRGLLRNVNR
jgi:hypothetical protein